MTIAQKLTRWWNHQSNWGAFWWGITHHDIRDAQIKIFSTGIGYPPVVGIYTPPTVIISTDLEMAFNIQVLQFDLNRFYAELDFDYE